MRRHRTSLLVALAVAFASVWSAAGVGADFDRAHEVWLIDQSDSVADGGGWLYIYDDDQLAGLRAATAAPEVINLGGAARTRCLTDTGTAPRRPHMLFFSPDHSRAVVSFVTTGHVLFLDAGSRQPVACIDAGVQAHAAVPAPDGSYVVVANQNGKLLQRISTDYEGDEYALDGAATVNLATCTTPGGAPCEGPARPDNAPICPVVDSSSRFSFVTLRGGGLLVFDSRRTPMAIVAEYDGSTVHPNGCGGVESSGKMYLNAGGGTPANPVESDLYAFPIGAYSGTPAPPNTPAPNVVFSHDSRGFVDSHGTTVSPDGRYVWVADRAANRMVVVHTRLDRVVNEFSLSGRVSSDPAPDLIAMSPNADAVYAALRGPNPLTANVAGVNNAVGSTPGLGVIRTTGAGGVMVAVASVKNVVGGVERADPHGIGVRLV